MRFGGSALPGIALALTPVILGFSAPCFAQTTTATSTIRIISSSTTTAGFSETATQAAASVLRPTLTSTAFAQFIQPAPPEIPTATAHTHLNPPRTWGQAWLRYGLRYQTSVFGSRILRDQGNAGVNASAPGSDDLVLLIGLDAVFDIRPWSWIGIEGSAGWHATPSFLSVSVRSPTEVDVNLSFAHMVLLQGALRGDIPVHTNWDLSFGLGPIAGFVWSKPASGFTAGVHGSIGVQLVLPKFPAARLDAFFRYVRSVEEVVEDEGLDITGIGLAASILFGD